MSVTINDAKRLTKRALLANIAASKRDLAITPLISGGHGIGKSQMVKSIAADLGGEVITIEGGTLKEGEITGLPYQYEGPNGEVGFRFLPYYAIERIQKEERRIHEDAHGAVPAERDCLLGDENRYAMNGLSPQERIEALLSGRVRPVIVFIDEINRTENTVYKELMNILLTRSVNGYVFPWWVLFVGAMNPSTQNSVYATNEMDPAQLDRFLKIKVVGSAEQWLAYGRSAGISPDILQFIKDNPKCLMDASQELDDEELPEPSPRGWDMVDTLLASEPLVRAFFTDEENSPAVVERDMRELVACKLGSSVATMFFASLVQTARAVSPEEIFADDAGLSQCGPLIQKSTAAKKAQTCDLMLRYLTENLEFLMLDKTGFACKKQQLAAMVEALDPSTRLLFAQNLAAGTTDEGNSLIELLFDIFESGLLSMLDLSEKTSKLIRES